MQFEIKHEEYVNKTFRIKKELAERLSIAAADSNVSLNEFVVQSCEFALDNLKPKQDEKRGCCKNNGASASFLYPKNRIAGSEEPAIHGIINYYQLDYTFWQPQQFFKPYFPLFFIISSKKRRPKKSLFFIVIFGRPSFENFDFPIDEFLKNWIG